jgi:uncharacterized membrane protein YfcA
MDLSLVVAASLVGAFVKSVTGMGYPLIAIPFLTLFMGVEDAVVIVSIPNTAANLLLNRGARASRSETRDLPVLAVASVVGAVFGTFLLIEAPEEPLVLGLAATVFVFVFQRLRSPDLRLAASTTRRWAPVAGSLAGVSQGAVGVSGPIVAMWFHGYRLSKNAYVFSVTTLFFMSGLAQLIVLIAAGEFSADRVVAAGLALVATLAVIPIGIRLRTRINAQTFELIILVLLIVSGLSLVARALT